MFGINDEQTLMVKMIEEVSAYWLASESYPVLQLFLFPLASDQLHLVTLCCRNVSVTFIQN